MDNQERLDQLVRELAQALAASRARLGELADEDERLRRAAAIKHVESYLALLNEAGGQGRLGERFWFKLEFPDGRWDVAEQLLAVPPRVGDLVSFDDGNRWRVRATQLVQPRPVRKPPREFFICALAA